MGLNTPALKYILSRSQKYRFRGPLLTLGNQDIYADTTTLRKWSGEFRLKPLTAADIKPSTSLGLQEINPRSSQFVHARTFFKLIGIQPRDYFDVDKFDFDKPRILHDLEKPFPKKYQKYFNLVIDSGTLEHVFDIKAVMDNITDITKIGGYVLELIPTNNFLNHGFYQVNPTFFFDYFTANGFKVVESYLVEFRPRGYRFHFFDQKTFQTFFVNPYSRLASLFLVKKIKDLKTTVSPTQYAYQQVAARQNTAQQPSNFGKYTDKLRHLLPFKYHAYFYTPWVFVKRIFSPKKYFDIDFE